MLARLIDDASRIGVLPGRPRPDALPPVDAETADAVRTLVDLAFPAASDEVAVRAVAAWTQLFGMISFELFGHFHNVIDDVDAVFERTLLEMGHLIGFGPPDRPDPDPEPEDGSWYLV